jgi:acetyl esterase/lipase
MTTIVVDAIVGDRAFLLDQRVQNATCPTRRTRCAPSSLANLRDEQEDVVAPTAPQCWVAVFAFAQLIWTTPMQTSSDVPTPTLMTAADLGPLCTPAGERIQYGSDPLQFGELTLPNGPGPHPLVINVHGGCWLAEYSIDHTRAMARALAGAGLAVWNLEYRRVGHEGGGWPGTFRDVSRGVEHARTLAPLRSLDLTRVCLMGHSAGGHLALWLAARKRLPRTAELYLENPLSIRGVVALAPATELRELQAREVFDRVVDRLMGGSPADVPGRYAIASPSDLVPLGVPQALIVGRHDDFWGWNAEAYFAAARAAGEPRVRLEIIENAGHFEVIAPASTAWPHVVAAAQEVLA